MILIQLLFFSIKQQTCSQIIQIKLQARLKSSLMAELILTAEQSDVETIT